MSFSQTIVIGNLGRDPELRFTPSGQQVCSFSIASNKTWTNADGTPGEKTTWFRVTAWGKLGEVAHQYLAKGRQVMVMGEIDASAWNGDDGTARASLELTAKTIKFLGGGNGNSDEQEETTPAPAVQQPRRPQASTRTPAANNQRQAPRPAATAPPQPEEEEIFF
jgi:single-strand DNA-binding protein